MTPPSSLELSTPEAQDILDRLGRGEALLPDHPQNVLEVVGVLKSYGVVLKAYAENLCYIADHQFLVLFPFFKYFNGEFSWGKLLRHWLHDRINYEYAEYCMRTMLWHGGGGLDTYLDSPEFRQRATQAIQAKLKGNPFMQGVNALFPEFLIEMVRMQTYYSALGQFWTVMYPIFLTLSDRYDTGEITSIPDVVAHIRAGLLADASLPITYAVTLGQETYDIIPKSAGLTFVADTAIPYVESVFLRGTPFFGIISYNAQAQQISADQSLFGYGALFADPLPTGAAGIPPTLLMQDMRHYLPDYLHQLYQTRLRGEDDLRVQICESFQKSMFCVTTAAMTALCPYPWNTGNPTEQKANRAFYQSWLDRLGASRLWIVQHT
ncbi:CO2 hydration protein [Candidatus Synechococcus calcipolaris G9]|uniref:CO2 hydration protein n=1 Tax=Candidatus Synechococcus calcipolaris G9 TaxID=1497997 RepID=A0ABT6F122_9SYNE|nr:CO2 hydration protein [Candidatus Synechococcus calcipolaris]MDG2991508.1 CO2 hydration protein [Candidatus Synechococcus calcipolaris G9]